MINVPCVPRPHMGGTAISLVRHSAALALFAAVLSLSVHATTKAQCESTRKKSVESCNKALQDAATASNANAAAAAKQVGNSKIKQSGDALSQSGQFNNGVLDKAIGDCDKARSSCDRDCDENKATNQQEKPEIARSKKLCGEEIDKSKHQANAGKQGGTQAEQGGQKTSDSSGGQPGGGAPPGGGSPQSGGEQPKPNLEDTSKVTDQKPDRTGNEEQEASAAAGPLQASAAPPDCTNAQAYLDDRCVQALAETCSSPQQRSTGLCRSFQVHYCTKGAQEGGAGGIKAGAGMGGDFCQGELANQFCHDARFPNRDRCPSCLKERGLPPPSETPDAETCGTDPMYSIPSNVARAGTGAPSAGGAGGASGAGGGGGGGSAANGGAKLVPENLKAGQPEAARDGMHMDTDGGGGGGSSSGGSGGGGLSGAFGSALEMGKRLLSGGRSPATYSGSVTDVEKRRVTNVFTILEEVYRNRCASGKFLHPCGPSK